MKIKYQEFNFGPQRLALNLRDEGLWNDAVALQNEHRDAIHDMIDSLPE